MAGIAVNIFRQLTGINFFIFYSTDVFFSMNLPGPLMTLLLSIANFGSGFIGIYTINNFGRKTNFTVGILVMAISLWLFTLENILFPTAYIAIPVAIIYTVAFGVGLGGTSYTFISDILPPSGIGIANLSQWICIGLIADYSKTAGSVIPFNEIICNNFINFYKKNFFAKENNFLQKIFFFDLY